jgi:hypothetical protein
MAEYVNRDTVAPSSLNIFIFALYDSEISPI